MAEYIDREALAMRVLGLTIVDPMVANYADAVLFQIQQAPAADVVEIPKGITNDLGLAVKGLGIFRLSWCVKSLEDDIEFRCSECIFEDKRTNKCSLKILLKRLATEEEWHKFFPLV